MKKLIYLASVIGLLTPGIMAQTTIRAIDNYQLTLDNYTSSPKGSNTKLVLADISDPTQGSKPQWRKFASEKALQKHRDASEVYSVAFAWKKSGNLAAVGLTLSSPSGDWTKYVNHYFRPDGSLAKAFVDYRTFHGDFIVERELYYGLNGKLIKKTTTYKDLQTRKPKKPEPGYLSDNSELLAGDVYQSVEKLPFAALLKK